MKRRSVRDQRDGAAREAAWRMERGANTDIKDSEELWLNGKLAVTHPVAIFAHEVGLHRLELVQRIAPSNTHYRSGIDVGLGDVTSVGITAADTSAPRARRSIMGSTPDPRSR